MRNKLIIAMVIILVLSTSGFTACRGTKQEIPAQIATVERGDLIVTVTADGNLDMPHQVELKFGTPGTVKKVFVEEGQKVKEGSLLAKMDDSTQKLAVATAQYNIELAMNELVEKIHPALMGLPAMYPDTSAVLRVEQANEELGKAQEFLEQGKYQDAASELRLAQHDLEASYYMFNVPEITMSLYQPDELLGTPIANYPDISKAINRLEQDLERLAQIQKLVEQGNYGEAAAGLTEEQAKLKETYLVVKGLSGGIRVSQRIGECCGQLTTQGSRPGATGLMPLPYPDTSTSLAWLKQVEENLQRIQSCKEGESCDTLELATLLRMAQHDVEMSRKILENNELIFRSGVNLKALRAYNLNLQLAEKELERAKEELMNTEILAPFDGTVVDVGVKENDQLSAFDYSSRTAVHMVDTKTVKFEGVVDEIDRFKVKIGQEAIIIVDALPDIELNGAVTFISPLGTQTTGVVEFPVTIAVDPSEIELMGGLTTTADIVVEKYENVLLLPNQAVKLIGGDHYVEVLIDEATRKTERRQVVPGVRNELFTEIKSGLSEGEKVIIDGTLGKAAK